MLLNKKNPVAGRLLGIFVLVVTSTAWSSTDQLRVQNIPPKTLTPSLDRAKLLVGLAKSRQQRINDTLAVISSALAKKSLEAVEAITLEIGSKSTPAKIKAEKQVERLQYYLEAIVWTNGRDDLIKATKSSADDFLKLKSGKSNTFAQLISLFIEGLYSGREESIEKLKAIINKKQTLQLAGAANLLLGDYFFTKKDYESARAYYLAALGHAKLARIDRANLRLAWTYFASARNSESIATLKASIISLKQNSLSSSNSGKAMTNIHLGDVGISSVSFRETLKRACVDVMLRVYAENSDLEQGHAALQALGFKDLIPEFYYDVGATNVTENQNMAVGINAFKKLALDFPRHKKSEQAAALAIDGNLKINLLDEAANLAQIFLKKLPKSRESSLLKTSIIQIADAAYQESFVKKDVISLADSLYSLVLTLPLQDNEFTRFTWGQAELSLLSNDTRKAANYFWTLAQRPEAKVFISGQRKEKKLNLHRFSLENTVVLAVNRDKTLFRTACLKLIELYDGKSPAIPACDQALPDILLKEKNTSLAIKSLDRKIERYPSNHDSFMSIKRIFELIETGTPERLVYAKKYLGIPNYQNTQDVKLFLRRLQFDEELVLAGKIQNPEERSKAILKIATSFTDDNRACSLILQTSKIAMRQNLFDAAERGLTELLKFFPNSSEAEEALFTLADITEKKFALETAANLYKEYTKKYTSTGARTIIAIQRQCDLATALDYPDALSACQKLTPYDKTLAKSALERLINKAFYEGRVDYLQTLVDTHYVKAFELSSNEKINALYKIYVANKRVDKPAVRAAAEIRNIYNAAPIKVTDDALKSVAELFYREILFTKNIYDAINLEKGGGRIESLVEAIAVKKRALDNFIFQITKIIKIGSPSWAAACYYQMGEAHESFAKMLRSPPAIEGIKPEDVVARLASQAMALDDEALRLYERSLETAWKFQIYNEFAVKSLDGQARLSGSDIRFKDYLESPLFINLDESTDGDLLGEKR